MSCRKIKKRAPTNVINATTDPSLTSTFHGGYIPSVAWDVEFTDEFGQWWETLSQDEQVELAAKVSLLEKYGPILPRPHSDVIVSSRHSNMKELRGRVQERDLRVLYAFDRRRAAILLIGGDKTGDQSWYRRVVPVADDLLDAHLAGLEREEDE
jgi:hypothetical protein